MNFTKTDLYINITIIIILHYLKWIQLICFWLFNFYKIYWLVVDVNKSNWGNAVRAIWPRHEGKRWSFSICLVVFLDLPFFVPYVAHRPTREDENGQLLDFPFQLVRLMSFIGLSLISQYAGLRNAWTRCPQIPVKDLVLTLWHGFSDCAVNCVCIPHRSRSQRSQFKAQGE